MSPSAKTGLIISGVVVALLVGGPLVWGGGGWGMMGPGMMGGFGWGWFMPLFGILFWVLVIWGVIALVRGAVGTGSSNHVPGYEDSAVDILKKRYARGEIGREEFEEKKKELL